MVNFKMGLKEYVLAGAIIVGSVLGGRAYAEETQAKNVEQPIKKVRTLEEIKDSYMTKSEKIFNDTIKRERKLDKAYEKDKNSKLKRVKAINKYFKGAKRERQKELRDLRDRNDFEDKVYGFDTSESGNEYNRYLETIRNNIGYGAEYLVLIESDDEKDPDKKVSPAEANAFLTSKTKTRVDSYLTALKENPDLCLEQSLPEYIEAEKIREEKEAKIAGLKAKIDEFKYKGNDEFNRLINTYLTFKNIDARLGGHRIALEALTTASGDDKEVNTNERIKYMEFMNDKTRKPDEDYTSWTDRKAKEAELKDLQDKVINYSEAIEDFKKFIDPFLETKGKSLEDAIRTTKGAIDMLKEANTNSDEKVNADESKRYAEYLNDDERDMIETYEAWDKRKAKEAEKETPKDETQTEEPKDLTE